MLKKWMVQELINLVWHELGRLGEEYKKYEEKEGMHYSKEWYERKAYWGKAIEEMDQIFAVLEDMEG